MGMAASQARFLGLTARRTNIEFEGQQINQQRTALANQSANYYNDLLGMSVPTPPSVEDFTKTVYSFDDGVLNNEITSMIAQQDGTYTVNYLSKWQEDYVPVAAATNILNSQNGQYFVGAQVLRTMGQVNMANAQVGNSIKINGVTYPVTQDPNGYSIQMTEKVASVQPCTAADIQNFEYYKFNANYTSAVRMYKDDATGTYYTLDDDGNRTDDTSVTENDLVINLWDGTQTDPEYAVILVTPNGDGTYSKEAWEDQTVTKYLTPSQIASITTFPEVESDERLSGLSSDEIAQVMQEEAAWVEMLNQKYGTDDWYIRYVKNEETGDYVPYFYKVADIEAAKNNTDNNGNILTNINCYTIGSDTRVKDVLTTGVKVERDSSGRFVSIHIPHNDGDGFAEYALTTNTITDQAAYDDAMNEYEHEKYLYDQAIQDINAKIEIVQAEDKNLELRLKQLDTEHNAVQIEMDAVSQVIKKNTESSFKTFG